MAELCPLKLYIFKQRLQCSSSTVFWMSSVETCSLSDTSKIMCFFQWWMDVPTFHFFSHFCKNEKFLTCLLPWISDYLFASLDYKAQLKWRSTLRGSFVPSSTDVDLHGEWTNNTYSENGRECFPLKCISSPLGVQSISLAEFWMSVSYSVDSHLNFATSKFL